MRCELCFVCIGKVVYDTATASKVFFSGCWGGKTEIMTYDLLHH